MPGHRGQLLLKKAQAKKAAEDSTSYKVSVYFCFKCKFFSPSQEHFDNHMTFLHLVPPQSVIGKFIALSTPNLLLSTFLRTSEVECEEDDSSTKDDSNQDEDDNDNGSEVSGVEKLPEATHHTSPGNDEFQEIDGNLDDAFVATPSRRNLVSEILTESEVPLPNLSVRNVENDSQENQIQRFTSTGGIRNTPKRSAKKRDQAGKSNLVGGANKKAKNVQDVGEYTTRYRATEKTKKLVIKHAKEAAMNVLKLNNSKVDGLDNENHGFFMLFKVGKKIFTACEGIAGKEFIENEDIRDKLIKESKNIDVHLNNALLTSLLKSQYGQGKNTNTPKSQKRQNYNGIGAQTKTKKKVPRHEASEHENVSITAKDKNTSEKRSRDKSFSTVSEKSGDTEDENRREWLDGMIKEATEPVRPSNSKKPRKEARQLFPFKCSRCNAKYKTKVNFVKHMKDKHALL